MTSVTLEDVLTIVYVLVDDWYQAHGAALRHGIVGAKPHFSDSEMLTLMVVHDFVPYPSERQYVSFIRANYLNLFPQVVEVSQYNRRSRALCVMAEQMRQTWLRQLGGSAGQALLLDTKPVPVLSYKRDKKHSQFAGRANYGHCAARKLNYFGFKLVMLCCMRGVPLVYNLVPANTDERLAAESVLDQVTDCDILADKGFIGEDWQRQAANETGNLIYIFARSNQKVQLDPTLNRFISRRRERIEGLFAQLQNTGRNLERLLAKTMTGLCTRVTLKVTSLTVRRLLLSFFHLDIQSFSI